MSEADYDFFDRGWCRFAHDPALARWVAGALPAARAAVRDPGNAGWLRCGGTWFAGVNVLPNDASGAIGCGAPLTGAATQFIGDHLGASSIAWDRGQVSVCYPGYPQPMASESEAAHRYRLDRDAAHLDGVLRHGPHRRRFIQEHHMFLLGLPLTEASPDASPFVVWEGSHEIVREAFRAALHGSEPDHLSSLDVTEPYHRARRRAFDACRRVEIAARPGEAYLVHRLALHGVAPWKDGAKAGPDGRMIVYFRPETDDLWQWLNAP